MKKTFSFILLLSTLCSTALFAQSGHSSVQVRLSDNAPIAISVDGTNYNNQGGVLEVKDIDAGQHEIQVFREPVRRGAKTAVLKTFTVNTNAQAPAVCVVDATSGEVSISFAAGDRRTDRNGGREGNGNNHGDNRNGGNTGNIASGLNRKDQKNDAVLQEMPGTDKMVPATGTTGTDTRSNSGQGNTRNGNNNERGDNRNGNTTGNNNDNRNGNSGNGDRGGSNDNGNYNGGSRSQGSSNNNNQDYGNSNGNNYGRNGQDNRGNDYTNGRDRSNNPGNNGWSDRGNDRGYNNNRDGHYNDRDRNNDGRRYEEETEAPELVLLTARDIAAIKVKVQKKTTDAAKSTTLQAEIGDRGFTTEQARGMIRLIKTEKVRLEFARWAVDGTMDIEYFSKLATEFKLPASKKEIKKLAADAAGQD